MFRQFIHRCELFTMVIRIYNFIYQNILKCPEGLKLMLLDLAGSQMHSDVMLGSKNKGY